MAGVAREARWRKTILLEEAHGEIVPYALPRWCVNFCVGL